MAEFPVHIDLSGEIKDWKEAVYGKEVRQANVRAFQRIQSQVNDTVDKVIGAVNQSNDAIEDAQDVLNAANMVLDEANNAVEAANTAVEDAQGEVEKAETARSDAAQSASEAEKWASGPVESSKYYNDKAKEQAERAETEADRAATYASIVAPGFYVDTETMSLYIKGGVGVDFVVVDDNILCWKIA